MSDPLPGILHVGLIILLVLLNGFFVSVEYAMVKVRSGRIDTLIEEGSKKLLMQKHCQQPGWLSLSLSARHYIGFSCIRVAGSTSYS